MGTVRLLPVILGSTLLMGIVCSQGPPPPAPPTLTDFSLIKRDLKDNETTTDRTWYYDSAGPNYPAIEFDSTDTGRPSPVIGVAYLRGTSSIDIDITFQNDNSYPVSGTFEILDARLQVPVNPSQDPDLKDEITLTVADDSIPFSVGSNASQTITLTVSGLPQTVALGELQIKYDFPLQSGVFDNGSKGHYMNWEWVYIVNDSPTGVQSVPWADFLNYTCRWAYGATGSDLEEKMTYGMHFSNRSSERRLIYTPNINSLFMYDASNSTHLDIALKKFTQYLDGSNVEMQCADFAGVLAVAFQSHGSAHQTKYIRAVVGGQAVSFYTGKMRKAGASSPTDPSNYAHLSFAFHYVASKDGLEFDSSSTYLNTLSGGDHKQPVSGWEFPGYWQTWVGSNVFGLAFGTTDTAAYSLGLATASKSIIGITNPS